MKQTLLITVVLIGLAGCTQESQNQIGRAINNWTGTNGILEVYAGNIVVKRFMKIDKLTTASGTSSDKGRPYRFGYVYIDMNLNNVIDKNEDKKVYFEFSDYSTPYIFFENPE